MQGPKNKSDTYKILKLAAIIVSILAALFVSLAIFVNYLNWSAEKNAKAFCDSIELGSDISLAINRFEKATGFEKKTGGEISALHYGYPDEGFAKDSHTFMFPGAPFDRAYCDVSLTHNGKVASKKSYFLYD